MHGERGNPAITQTVEAHLTICGVGEAEPVVQVVVDLGIVEDVCGGVVAEVAEEIFLVAETMRRTVEWIPSAPTSKSAPTTVPSVRVTRTPLAES
jgi:hypothetical protein